MLRALIFSMFCGAAIFGQKIPDLPPQFAASFISTSNNSQSSKVVYGAIYYNQKINKAALWTKSPLGVEHLVFNYDTKNVLVTGSNIKNCQLLTTSFFSGYSDPKNILAELTNSNLQYHEQKLETDSGISGNLWTRSTSPLDVRVTYNVPPWTFPTKYVDDKTIRPLSVVITNNTDFSSENFYFMEVMDKVPDEVMMPDDGVFCPVEDETHRQPPTLPRAFSVVSESGTGDDVAVTEVFFNDDAQVMRESNFIAGVTREVVIIDRKLGVVYLMDDATGSCIQTFAVNDKNAPNLTPNMVLFQSNDLTDFKYIGNRTCWQENCEVWAVGEGDVKRELYLKYFRQNNTDVYVPVKLNWINMKDDTPVIHKTSYFNFLNEYPSWSKFDVSACYPEVYKLRFQISLRGPALAIGDIFEFERRVQMAIKQHAATPEMRMHEIRIDSHMNENILVTLTLLEDPRRAGMNGSFTSDPDYSSGYSNWQIYNIIANAVSDGQFKVAVKAQNGKEIEFIGNSITREIISEQKVEEKGSSLAKFKPRYNQAIDLQNSDTQLDGLGLSVDSCAKQCDGDKSGSCNMFMYCKNTRTCTLSESFDDERPHHYNSNCDLYYREYAYDYDLYPGMRMNLDPTTDSMVNDEPLRNCFADCHKKQGNASGCHSIDYCTDGKRHSCIFHAKHALQVDQTTFNFDSNCLHYSLQMLNLFRVFPSKSVTNAEKYAVVKYSVSADECARNCFLDVNGCTEFEMCSPFPGTTQKTTCLVFEAKSPNGKEDVTPAFKDDEKCDHYHLKGVRTDFHIDTTGENPNKPEEVKPKPTGYSSGSMAGLAIPMLIIAGLAGAGLTYYYIIRQKQAGNEENFVLKFVQE